MEFSLADLFESVVDAAPDREALTCVGPRRTRRLTYAELDAAANQFAHHLRWEGIRPGEHVGIALHNGVEHVQAVLGCLKMRAVPVNINHRYLGDELAEVCATTDVAALVYEAAASRQVATAAARCPGIRHLVRVGTPEDGAPDLPATPIEMIEAHSADRDFAARSGDDLFILCTGGTTGQPKGVLWRQEDMFLGALGGGNPVGEPISRPEELAEKVAAGAPGITFLTTAPLVYGTAMLTLFITFFMGQRLVLCAGFDAREAVRTIEEEKVNILVLVGDAMARPMAEALAGADVSSLFTISSSGAVLSGHVRSRWLAALPNLLIMDNFGSCESGFIGTAVDGTNHAVGFRLAAGPRSAVLDEVTRGPAPVGVPGRIAHSGHVPLGYYRDEELSAATFFTGADGTRWVLLGDMGVAEADGTITVLGRGAQCINTGGEKVFTEEVEAVLKSHPAVADAAVVGVPDDTYGQRVAAVVATTAPLDADGVRGFCGTRLARFKVPRVVVFVDHVQRGVGGKTDYAWAGGVVAAAGENCRG